jgi:cellulose synthase/poly-beta-1,6-N-acetylglucosamine synthase-like glycosyltransferase
MPGVMLGPMPALNRVLWALVLAMAAPLVVWIVECASALLLPARKVLQIDGRRPTVTILIPAHNEASGIRETLASVLPQLGAGDRVVVIADNCTDETASIARDCGATVIERIDPARRGKSYAVESGMKRVKGQATDVVMVIDADCIAQPDAIANLARMTLRTGRPVQASYYLEPAAVSRPEFQVAALAFFIKNVVRPSGLARLGFPCFLNGSGMAFPIGIVQSVNWGNDKIAEDCWSTVDIALAGHLPGFCEDSRISSRLPEHSRALVTQRTRWIHGHLATMFGQAPRLVASGIGHLRPGLLVLALDLLVPPFSLLILLWLAGMGIAVLAGLTRATWGPAVFLAVCGLVATVLLAVIAGRFGDAGLWELLVAAPRFLSSRIRLLVMFVLRRERQWVATSRDRE